jgi:hypothetical protein
MSLVILNIERSDFGDLLGIGIRKILINQGQNAEDNENNACDFHRTSFQYCMMRTDRKRCRCCARQLTCLRDLMPSAGALDRRSAARHEGDDKQDEEYDEQDPGDFRCETCNTDESQDSRNDGDD